MAKIKVSQHSRSRRRDDVGEMLIAASKLKAPSTLRDFILTYSKSKGLQYHLDYAEFRSKLSQSQARLRPDVIEDGKIIRVSGDFNSLLGTKLFPSASLKPGKTSPQWCEGVVPMTDTIAEPDWLMAPIIQDLIMRANAAGDRDFVRGARIQKIARYPKATRVEFVDELKIKYATIMRQNAEIEDRDAKIVNLSDRLTNMEGEIRLLNDLRDRVDEIMRNQTRTMEMA